MVGHAFLGSAQRGAHLDGQSLITALKPIVMGQDPLDRERLYQGLMSRARQTTLRAIGAVDIALWDIAGKVANLPIHRLLGSYRDRAPAYASSAVLATKQAYAEEAARFKSDGWTAYKIHPPTDPEGRHRDLPGRARHGGRRLHRHARLDVGVRLSRGDPRRDARSRSWASTGTRTPWPTTTSTTTSS